MESKRESGLHSPVKKLSTNTTAIILLITFILLLEVVGGGILYYAHVKEKNCSVITEGTLVKWGERTRKNRKKYFPIVEYRAGNELYTGISNVESRILPIKEGETVIIGYNPSDPSDYYMEGYELNHIRSFAGIFILLGAVVALVNIICAILNRVKMDEKKRIRRKEVIFVAGFFLVYYWIMIQLIGLGMALFLSIFIGLMVIYVKYKNRPPN